MAIRRQTPLVGTAAEWAAANPVLRRGQIGIVADDPSVMKVGDGVTDWLTLSGFIPEALLDGGTPGGASPEEVRTILSDTLRPGEGISIERSGDMLEVASTVGVTTAIRPWEASELLYATPFDGGIPSWLSVETNAADTVATQPSIVSVAATPGAAKPGAYSTAVALPGAASSANSANRWAQATLDLAALPGLAGRVATQVKAFVSFNRGSGSIVTTGAVRVGVVDQFTYAPATGPTATDWAQVAATIDTSRKVSFRVTRTSTSGTWNTSAIYFTGLEVYGTAQPWMFNDIAAYQGNLWRSMQDNNPHVPGSGQGWQQV